MLRVVEIYCSVLVRDPYAREVFIANRAMAGRCTSSRMQLIHSLNSPGFNPCTYHVRAWFKHLLSHKIHNLFRYVLSEISRVTALPGLRSNFAAGAVYAVGLHKLNAVDP